MVNVCNDVRSEQVCDGSEDCVYAEIHCPHRSDDADEAGLNNADQGGAGTMIVTVTVVTLILICSVYCFSITFMTDLETQKRENINPLLQHHLVISQPEYLHSPETSLTTNGVSASSMVQSIWVIRNSALMNTLDWSRQWIH